MNFERIKKNYETQLWSKDMVRLAVKKGIISEAQYFDITKEEYKEE